MPGTLVAEHLNRPLFDTGTATAVAFPKSATVEKVEEATLGFLKENNLLILDMSDVTFIDVAGLTAIIALLAGRQSQARATKLRLPLSEKVRHFFRRWAFPQAIRAVTGIRFFDIVIAEDHKYFQGVGGDRGEGYAGPTARYEMRGGDIFVPLEVKRFFWLSILGSCSVLQHP